MTKHHFRQILMVKLVKNRAVPLVELLKDKDVLEIGCVGMGKHDTLGGSNFIAGYVKPIARRWLGIDINAEGIERLRKCGLGFDLRNINAEEPFNLNETFDVVLAEEVIEHLTNFPVFLKNVYLHLARDGVFVITTPNPISPSFFYQRLVGGKIKDVSIWNHTHWQTHETLTELLKRYGFEIFHHEYIHPEPGNYSLSYQFIRIFWRLVPNQFGRNLIVFARKKQQSHNVK